MLGLQSVLSLIIFAIFPLLAAAQDTGPGCNYNQCYGPNWGAPGGCCNGWTCTIFSIYYGQCTPNSASSSSSRSSSLTSSSSTRITSSTTSTRTTSSTTTSTRTSTSTASGATQTLWGQCGGKNWTGPTTCPPGSYCLAGNDFYSQCVTN